MSRFFVFSALLSYVTCKFQCDKLFSFSDEISVTATVEFSEGRSASLAQ